MAAFSDFTDSDLRRVESFLGLIVKIESFMSMLKDKTLFDKRMAELKKHMAEMNELVAAVGKVSQIDGLLAKQINMTETAKKNQDEALVTSDKAKLDASLLVSEAKRAAEKTKAEAKAAFSARERAVDIKEKDSDSRLVAIQAAATDVLKREQVVESKELEADAAQTKYEEAMNVFEQSIS